MISRGSKKQLKEKSTERVTSVSQADLEPKDPETEAFKMNLLIALNLATRHAYNTAFLDADEESSDSSEESVKTDEKEEREESSRKETEEPLKTCTAREYIYRTIGWPLLIAIAALDRERPANPIEFIASYLLFYKNEKEEEMKNKEQYDNPLDYYTQVKKKDLVI